MLSASAEVRKAQEQAFERSEVVYSSPRLASKPSSGRRGSKMLGLSGEYCELESTVSSPLPPQLNLDCLPAHIESEAAAHPTRSTIPPNSASTGPAYELQYFDNKPYAAGSLIKQLGNPTPYGLCVFSVTITSLSFFLMELSGSNIPNNVLIGNFFFLSGLGLLISGQWELVIGNTFGFVVFSSFAGFYLSFGAILQPDFGVAAAYADAPSEYYTALGYYLVGYCMLLFVFMVAAMRTNIAFLSVFVAALLTLVFLAAAYFAGGQGHMHGFTKLKKTGGAFAFITGMIGWYLIFAQLFEIQGFDIKLPVGDLSHMWCKKQQALKAAAVKAK